MKKLFFTFIIASFAMVTLAQNCYTVSNTSPVPGGCEFEVSAKYIWSYQGFFHQDIFTETIVAGNSHEFCFALPYRGAVLVSVNFDASCPNFSQFNLPLNAPQTYTGGNCHGAYPADEVRWGANGSHYFKIESNK